MNNQNVIYVDETTFHQWRQPTKLWLKESLSDIIIPTKRKGSILAIEALSNKQGLIVLKVTAESNTKETFIEFFDEQLLYLVDKKATIFFDNLRQRHCKEV